MRTRRAVAGLAVLISMATALPAGGSAEVHTEAFVNLVGSTPQSSGNHRAEQVAVDSAGRIWLASVDRTVPRGSPADRQCGRHFDGRGCGRIGRISLGGAVSFVTDAPGGLSMERPLDVTTVGRDAYVADRTGHVIWRVRDGASSASELIRLYLSPVNMVFPTDVLARGGGLWVLGSLDTGNDVVDSRRQVGRIVRIDIATGQTRVWATPGLRDLAGMAFDATGRLWFSGNGVVEDNQDVGVGFGRLNPASTNPPQVFRQSAFTGERFISAPSEMTRGPDGQLWFIDNGTSQVGRFRAGNPTGTLQFLTGDCDGVGDPPPNGVCGGRLFDLTVGPGGDIFYSRSRADEIGRITTEGDVTSAVPPVTGFDQPYGLARRNTQQLVVALPAQYGVAWYEP